jgi:type I restriction enzyme S subunit
MAKNTKPAIRFKGFTDAWEQRKLGAVAEKTYGGGTPATSNEAYWNGNLPWIQSSDIVDGKLFGVEPRKRITQAGLNNSATQLVPENSIAIITRVGVGKLAFMPFSYATSQDFLSLSKLNTEPFFTVYACYKKLQSELGAVQGTSIKGITKDELLAKVIMVPQYAEQQQIGAFFSELDNLITLHQRKYDSLVNVKKAMLEKMFPKNGETVPEIRFKGFTDAWEQRKLGEIYEVNNERNEGQYPVEKTLSIATMTFNEQGNGADTSSLSKYKVLRIGDLAFEGHTNKEFRYGRFVLNNIENGIMSPRFTALRPITKQNFNFWEYYIHSERVMRSRLVNATKAGTMMNELVPEDLFRQTILMPSILEQEQIGAYFKHLDHLITLHQRKLEKLKNIKKSCLEKMFV